MCGGLGACTAEGRFFSGWRVGAGTSVTLGDTPYPDYSWRLTGEELVVSGKSQLDLETLFIRLQNNQRVLAQQQVRPDSDGRFEVRFRDHMLADTICVENFCSDL